MPRENRHARRPRVPSPACLGEDDLPGLLLHAGGDALVLILDCVQDPHNLGAILRTAESAGVTAVVAPRDKSAPLTETVRRISTGASDLVPFVRVTNLARAMKSLQKAGLWLTGSSDRAAASLYEADLTGPAGIVIGSEGSGLRRLTGETCDRLVRIPMAGRIECLNASVAAGILLFEARRQRLSPI